ncbi:MAG: O-antigen ligase family protein [Solirubrobacterales bacterium]
MPHAPSGGAYPVIVAGVAGLYVALAVANGGYSSELTAAATVGVWWAVAIGLAVGEWPRARVPSAAVGAGACLTALAAWTAISIGWAGDNGGAFIEVVRALGYLGLFVLIVIASPRASARAWLGGLGLGLLIVAVIALASRFEPSLAGDEDLRRLLPAAAGRLSYPIGYWNGLAAAMAAGVLLMVWLGGHARAAWLRSVAVAAMPLPILVIYFASSRGGVIAAAAGLVVLLSLGPARARMLAGAFLGGAGGVLLCWLASRKHELVDALGNSTAASQGDQMLALTIVVVGTLGIVRYLIDGWLAGLEVPRRLTRGVIAATLVAVIAGILVADPSARWSEFKQVGALETKSTYVAAHLGSGSGSGRYQFWTAALDGFADHPLDGIGAGGYEAYWDQHGALAMPVRNAHSLFFETMAELGVIGLLLLVAFLVAPIVAGLRRGPTRAPGAALSAALALFTAGLVSAGIDWTWELPACFGLVVLVGGLLAGPATLGLEAAPGAQLEGVNGSRTPSPAPGPRLGLGIATLLVAGAAIWAGGVLFLTETKLGDSREAASAGDLESAAHDARDAIKLEPWAAGPRLQLALVDELGGDLRAAKRDLAGAIERAPDNWQLWFVRTRIDVKSGDVREARHALERARRLNPRAPFFAQ